MSKSEAGKGGTYRKVDGKKYRENYDRVFRNLIEENKMGNITGNSFGDVDRHQEVQQVFNKLRGLLVDLQLHVQDNYSLVQKLQEFIPHLKRTDKDHGSLPFYSTQYVSTKTNRDHCLVCLVSKVVQTYWDFADDTIEDSEMVLFFTQVTTLESIAADGFSNYRVTGKYPTFYLDTVTNIERALAAVENAAQIAAEEEAQIKADAENPTQEQSSGESGADSTPQNEGETDTSGSEVSSSTNVEVEDEVVTDDANSSDVDTPAEESKSADQNNNVDSDQLSTELADKCSGDCDSCTDKVCDDSETKDIPPIPDDDVAPLDDDHNLLASGGYQETDQEEEEVEDAACNIAEETEEPEHTDEEIEDTGPQ